MKYFNLKSHRLKKNLNVGIIGYGIQGRACAMNLRDSGQNVYVYQIKDKNLKQLINDNFKNSSLKEIFTKCEIIIILVPDASHKNIIEKIKNFSNKNNKIVILPSGYTCTFENIKNNKKIKFFLISPRYPGQVLRKNFLEKIPTLGFYGYLNKPIKSDKNKVLSIAKAWGMTNLFLTTMQEEAYIDLFIENFLIPRIMGTIEQAYNTMSQSGIQKHIAMLEVYQSGEIIGLFNKGLRLGMFNSFHKHTSPTCQFAVSDKYKILNNRLLNVSKSIFSEIKNKNFYKKLSRELSYNYKNKENFNQKKLQSQFTDTQIKLINFLNKNKINY